MVNVCSYQKEYRAFTEYPLRVDQGRMIDLNESSCKFAPFKLDAVITIVSFTVMGSDRLMIESGPLSSEDKPLWYKSVTGKEQGTFVIPQIRLAWFLSSFSSKEGYYCSGVTFLNY